MSPTQMSETQESLIITIGDELPCSIVKKVDRVPKRNLSQVSLFLTMVAAVRNDLIIQVQNYL